MDDRRKRILFRSQHRGMVETDFFLGRFAVRYLPSLSDDQLDRLEALLEEGDNDLFNWISGKVPPPADHDNDIMRLMIVFNNDPQNLA